MRAELYRREQADDVVAIVTWADGAPSLDAREDVPGLNRLLRPTAVVTDDPSLRSPGTSGEVVLEPGSVAWFRAALTTRAPELGLAVRFVAERITGGWDPAAAYTPFEEQVERLSSD
ncbi:MAG TPA: hypothetical protein VJ774_03695 [Actinomycetota bacterium]|nr:hypothetical protein [Actinomycetota bacterium]